MLIHLKKLIMSLILMAVCHEMQAMSTKSRGIKVVTKSTGSEVADKRIATTMATNLQRQQQEKRSSKIVTPLTRQPTPPEIRKAKAQIAQAKVTVESKAEELTAGIFDAPLSEAEEATQKSTKRKPAGQELVPQKSMSELPAGAYEATGNTKALDTQINALKGAYATTFTRIPRGKEGIGKINLAQWNTAMSSVLASLNKKDALKIRSLNDRVIAFIKSYSSSSTNRQFPIELIKISEAIDAYLATTQDRHIVNIATKIKEAAEALNAAYNQIR